MRELREELAVIEKQEGDHRKRKSEAVSPRTLILF